jgi:hypothetical protein
MKIRKAQCCANCGVRPCEDYSNAGHSYSVCNAYKEKDDSTLRLAVACWNCAHSAQHGHDNKEFEVLCMYESFNGVWRGGAQVCGNYVGTPEPCPFCGGTELTVQKEDTGDRDSSTAKWEMFCSNYVCGCSIGGAYASRTEAIAHWNQRTVKC